MKTRAMCQTITRVRPAAPAPTDPTPTLDDDGLPITTDSNGQPLPDERADVAYVSLQPLRGQPSTETQGVNFDVTVDRWMLFAPPDTDLVTTDRVQQSANPFVGVLATDTPHLDLEVDGDPVIWPGADGLPHHMEAYLKKYGGGH